MKSNLQLQKQVKYYFGCTFKELDDACWQSIINSNDYYREFRGEITRIEEIKPYIDEDDYLPNTCDKELLATIAKSRHLKNNRIEEENMAYCNYGVVPYERNIQICYEMYNDSKHKHPCSTTVFWSSFNGGRLSHGTHPRGVVSFKSNGEWMKGYTPSIDVCFKIYRPYEEDNYKLARHICFGGTCATLESKIKLINLILRQRNLCFSLSYVNYKTEDRFHIRDVGRACSCEQFIKELMRGKYTPVIESKEKKIVKLNKLLGTSLNDTLIYKRTYTDGSMAYVRVDNPNKVKQQSPF